MALSILAQRDRISLDNGMDLRLLSALEVLQARREAEELARVYATDEAIRDGIDFYSLSGFSLVICKPDRKIIYSDCQWSAIQENATLGSMVLEKVTLVASRRIETEV